MGWGWDFFVTRRRVQLYAVPVYNTIQKVTYVGQICGIRRPSRQRYRAYVDVFRVPVFYMLPICWICKISRRLLNKIPAVLIVLHDKMPALARRSVVIVQLSGC
jgi:hypothetical protein